VTRIAILSRPADVHALAVHEALLRKGALPVLCMASDYPARSPETVRTRRGAIEFGGPFFDGQSFDTVWFRRPAHAFHVSPDDGACRAFRAGLFALWRRSGFWVNDPQARDRAEQKPLQHALAVEAGFDTPHTLYSNDAAAVQRFVREHGGRAVFKNFHPAAWSDGRKRWQPATAIITEEHLAGDGLIALTPAIYQELVPKAYELRVTVIGHRVFAAKLHSQTSAKGQLDWRRAGDAIVAEATRLPPDVEAMCHDLVARLGLVFGCIDLIVTPDGRHVFLEINQMGQFLFIERWTGLPLLDAFAELLLQGHAGYLSSPSRRAVRFADVVDRARAHAGELSRIHSPAPERMWTEEVEPGRG
jgi:glutathione synthase/RimK-type ligase-like ATP-grasp enzyme